MSRGWLHFLARNAPASVRFSYGDQTHCTSISMSYLHLTDLFKTLSVSCISLQTNTCRQTHGNGVGDNGLRPHPTCPNLDRADLYHIVNMPKVWNRHTHVAYRMHVCVCFWDLCALMHSRIDGDRKPFNRMRVDDRQPWGAADERTELDFKKKQVYRFMKNMTWIPI